jgi:GDP-4-dehydro-6-deoxy-D-mannose reductase
MMRVLLTGASGFIGTRLLKHLRLANVEVLSVGRTPLRHGTPSNVEHRIVTELTADSIGNALGNTRIDGVIHLAAAGINPQDRDQRSLRRTNGFLPADLAAAAHTAGARAFVMSGSSAEYARFDGDCLDETCPLETLKSYGATKAAGSLLAVATAVALGMAGVNLRLFNVYGPGEASHRLLPALRASLLNGKEVPLSEGHQLRDFIHVDDACHALVDTLAAALHGQLSSGHYNVCTGHATSVRSFALQVARSMDADTSLLKFGALPLRPDDQPRVVGNPGALVSLTKWRPRLDLADGIAHTLSEMSQVESAGIS